MVHYVNIALDQRKTSMVHYVKYIAFEGRVHFK